MKSSILCQWKDRGCTRKDKIDLVLEKSGKDSVNQVR
jgi:hypothetical protein